jgi:HK97 gp10 family phage protein
MADVKIKVKTKNFKKFKIKIKNFPKNLTEDLFDILISGSTDLRNEIMDSMQNTKKASWSYARGDKKHHPSKPGSPPAVDGGELFRSIIMEPQKSKLAVTTGVTGGAPYAKFLEKGTKIMAKRPFMKPAFEKILPSVETDIKKSIMENIK